LFVATITEEQYRCQLQKAEIISDSKSNWLF